MGAFRAPTAISPTISTWTSGAMRDLVAIDGARWKGANTVKFLPSSCAPAFGWPTCGVTAGMLKARTPVCNEIEFDGIGIYSDVYCPDGGHPAFIEFEQLGAEALRNNWQFVMAEELMDGTWTELAGAATNRSGNPVSNARKSSNGKGSTIRSAATAIPTPNGPVQVMMGISALLREWRRFTVTAGDPENNPRGLRNGTTPVLHLPDWALMWLPESSTMLQGRELRTNYGTVIVAPGPGYSGNGPHAPGPPPAPVDMPPGQFWMYLTGPTVYDISMVPDPVWADGLNGFDTDTNLKTNLKEMNSIAAFDTCGVFGILVQGDCD